MMTLSLHNVRMTGLGSIKSQSFFPLRREPSEREQNRSWSELPRMCHIDIYSFFLVLQRTCPIFKYTYTKVMRYLKQCSKYGNDDTHPGLFKIHSKRTARRPKTPRYKESFHLKQLPYPDSQFAQSQMAEGLPS
jgi:hypothetical protein